MKKETPMHTRNFEDLNLPFKTMRSMGGGIDDFFLALQFTFFYCLPFVLQAY